MEMTLDLDLVRCFLHVAESGGFTRASRRLHLSQSAVSLKIQRLEDLLGKKVFERTSRTLSLTGEGELLLGYARRLIALNEEAVRAVSGRTEGGHLNLGIAQQFGQKTLFRLLSRFRRTHPDITLGIETGMSGQLMQGLEDARFDLVIAAEGPAANPVAVADGIIRDAVVSREPMRWVRATGSQIDPRKNPLPLVVLPPPCGHRQLILELLERQKRSWRVGYTSPSLPAVQAAIEADCGIGILPVSLITPRMRPIPKSAALPALPQ
ncbi:MAG: LysR family transcriptional regulator, partial [Verrucomicrobiaceae bacterium]